MTTEIKNANQEYQLPAYGDKGWVMIEILQQFSPEEQKEHHLPRYEIGGTAYDIENSPYWINEGVGVEYWARDMIPDGAFEGAGWYVFEGVRGQYYKGTFGFDDDDEEWEFDNFRRATVEEVLEFSDAFDNAFDELRRANIARQIEWDTGTEKVSALFKTTEAAGEFGEMCNVVKKLERERLGMKGSRDTVEHLAEEMADVIICVDLIAEYYGIDLWQAVRSKFNKTSEKNGFKTMLRAL